MAMKVGGEYRFERIGPRHFEKLAEEAGLAKPLVRRRVTDLAIMVIEALKTAATGRRSTSVRLEPRFGY